MALWVSLSLFLDNTSWQDAGGVDWCRNLREVAQWGADKQELAGTWFWVQENGCDPGAGQGRDTDILSCDPTELLWLDTGKDPDSKFEKLSDHVKQTHA